MALRYDWAFGPLFNNFVGHDIISSIYFLNWILSGHHFSLLALGIYWGILGWTKINKNIPCVSFFFCHNFLKSLLLLRNLPIHDPIRLRGCNCVSPSSFFSLSDVPHFLVCGTDMKIGKGSVLNHFIYLLK